MERIAAYIALQLLPEGGLLLHGALAEYLGSGYVLAGPSGVGKSTSSIRLPAPHRSLSDDRTLVVRGRNGGYWAHPWPTWSRLLNGDCTCSWPVEQAVPLRGIFFLSQSVSERLRPTGRTQAAAKIMESAIDLTRTISKLTEGGASPHLWVDHLAAARALSAAVPVYSLDLSLRGQFWREVEQVLPNPGSTMIRPSAPRTERSSDNAVHASESALETSEGVDDRLRAVCLDRAMWPIIDEADILEVEPYKQCRLQVGDIVCFKSPKNGETCVRRVISVEARNQGGGRIIQGIRTRGDNVRQIDPWVLQDEEVIGRVVVVRRAGHRRCVSRGYLGWIASGFLRGSLPLRGVARRVHLLLRRPSMSAGFTDWKLPQFIRPRLTEFNGRHCVDIKLYLGKHEIGRFGCIAQTWRIRSPFRALVDVNRLPAPPRWSLPSFVQASAPAMEPLKTNSVSAPLKSSARAGGGASEDALLNNLSSTPWQPDDACQPVSLGQGAGG